MNLSAASSDQHGYLHCANAMVTVKTMVLSIVIARAKPDLPFRDRRKSLNLFHLVREPVDVLNEDLNDGGRAVVAALQLLYTDGNVLVVCNQLPHADEGLHYQDAHLDGTSTI